MVFESVGSRPFGIGPHAGELIADYRARIALEQAEKEQHRQSRFQSRTCRPSAYASGSGCMDCHCPAIQLTTS
jgi:hypothetical protein